MAVIGESAYALSIGRVKRLRAKKQGNKSGKEIIAVVYPRLRRGRTAKRRNERAERWFKTN